MSPRKKKTVGYLRVSMVGQDLNKNKADILAHANDRDFGKVQFIEEKVSGKKSWKERKLKSIIDEMGEGDRLIVQGKPIPKIFIRQFVNPKTRKTILYKGVMKLCV